MRSGLTCGVRCSSALVLIPVLACLLGGCVKITTNPAAAKSYYGSWSGPGVELLIVPGRILSVTRTVAARVAYRHPAMRTHIDCTFEGLSGNDIAYECGDNMDTIPVNVPPHQVRGVWKMTVAGVEVTRQK